MDNVCLNCEERHLHCHSNCERYNKARIEHQKDKEYLNSFKKYDTKGNGRAMTGRLGKNGHKGIEGFV